MTLKYFREFLLENQFKRTGLTKEDYSLKKQREDSVLLAINFMNNLLNSITQSKMINQELENVKKKQVFLIKEHAKIVTKLSKHIKQPNKKNLMARYN